MDVLNKNSLEIVNSRKNITKSQRQKIKYQLHSYDATGFLNYKLYYVKPFSFSLNSKVTAAIKIPSLKMYP